MRLLRTISHITVYVALAMTGQADAQPLFGDAKSIDYAVTDADHVIIGRIADFGGTEQPDLRRATILVEETLKGEHQPKLVVRLSDSASSLANWKDQSRRLLVAIKEGSPGESTVIDLSEENLEALTADFALLRNPAAVIAAAKEAVRRMPGVTRIHGFGLAVPQKAVAGTRWHKYYGTGGSITLSVPVDDRLEMKAHERLRTGNLLERVEAARALRYFRTEENIALMKERLGDPGWAYLHRAEENKGLEVRVYLAREEAYRTLESWGLESKKPLIREEELKLARVEVADLSNNEVTQADLKELLRFKNLHLLILSNDVLTEDDIKQISALKSLQSLWIGGTTVIDAWLDHLSVLTDLRYLDLRTTKVSVASVKVLARYKGLKQVDLGQTKVTDEGVAELRRLRPDLKIDR